MYRGRTVFRTRRMSIFWLSAITVGIAIAVLLSYRTVSAEDWYVPLFFMAFFVLGVFALVEAATNFLALGAHDIRFRKTFRSVHIKKADIELVTWTAGGGVSLKLSNGKWVMIPNMGYDSQGLTNSIRGWLES